MATSNATAHSRPIMVDQTWERCQEQALQAFRKGDVATARANWAKGLEIAERHFERGDPRIATSLSNQAFALLRQKNIHLANSHFEQAMIAWEESWRWVPWMTPSTQPGDDEAAPYDRETQEIFYSLICQGKEITEVLWRENRLSAVEGDDWQTVKPKTMTDIRRLFSAVFLLPTERDRRLPASRRSSAA